MVTPVVVFTENIFSNYGFRDKREDWKGFGYGEMFEWKYFVNGLRTA